MAGWNDAILFAINQGWASRMMDEAALFLSSNTFAGMFASGILALLINDYGRRRAAEFERPRKAALFAWLAMLAIVLLSDALGGLAKRMLAAPRPCLELADQVRQIVACTGAERGMPSNHALTWSCATLCVALLTRRRAWTIGMGTAAFAVGLSRIYLARHYPSQVLVGAALGLLWGWWLYTMAAHFLPFLRPAAQAASPSSPRSSESSSTVL